MKWIRRAFTTLQTNMKFIDIGANLTDTMYAGEYNGTARHPPDLPAVIGRAQEAGVEKMMVTGGNLEESRKAIELSKKYPGVLYATVGCHPTRCGEFVTDPDTYFNQLLDLIKNNKEQVVAIGEFGLDYDRTKFCDKETQQKFFEKQLDLCKITKLPMFLHCRAAGEDLVSVLSKHKSELSGGVVHSFDGSASDRDSILDLGYFVGINGCSLKTQDNLSVMSGVPSERLMLETDCPWCEVRPSHAGYGLIQSKFTEYPAVDKKKWKEGAVVKSRNEPHNIRQILEIVSAVKKEDPEELSRVLYNNTMKVFFENL